MKQTWEMKQKHTDNRRIEAVDSETEIVDERAVESETETQITEE